MSRGQATRPVYPFDGTTPSFKSPSSPRNRKKGGATDDVADQNGQKNPVTIARQPRFSLSTNTPASGHDMQKSAASIR
jgi:hypothetical protein